MASLDKVLLRSHRTRISSSSPVLAHDVTLTGGANEIFRRHRRDSQREGNVTDGYFRTEDR